MPFAAVTSTSAAITWLASFWVTVPFFAASVRLSARTIPSCSVILPASDCSFTFPPAAMSLSLIIAEWLITVTSPVATSTLSFTTEPFSASSSMLPLISTRAPVSLLPASMMPFSKLPAFKTPVSLFITLPSSDCSEILWLTSPSLRTIILPLLVTVPLPRNTTSPFFASSVPAFATVPLSASRVMPRFFAP